MTSKRILGKTPCGNEPSFLVEVGAAERRAVVRVKHLHPEWTLGDLLGYVERGGTRSAALRGLTMSELPSGPEEGSLALPCDGGPAVDVVRLEQAKRARGEEFDRLLALTSGAARHSRSAMPPTMPVAP
jgi:hypothetical protein